MPALDSYVKLCLHGNADYSDASASAHTQSSSGVSIDTSRKKWGAGSFLFSSGYILCAGTLSDFELGTSNFVWEWWEYRTSTATGAAISRDRTTVYVPFLLGLGNSGTGKTELYMSGDGGSWSIAQQKSLGSFLLNEWVHYAVVRSGSNFFTYQNGAQKDTWSSAAAFVANANSLCFGSFAGGNYYPGSLDEIVLHVGTDLGWTGSTIIVPDGEYTVPIYSFSTWLGASRRALARKAAAISAGRIAEGISAVSASLDLSREGLGVARKQADLNADRAAEGPTAKAAAFHASRPILGKLRVDLNELRPAREKRRADLAAGRLALQQMRCLLAMRRNAVARDSVGFSAARLAHVKPGYYLYDVTGDENYLGFIAEGSTALPGLAFPPGIYTIEVRTSRFFWEGARTTQRFRVEVHAAAAPEVWEIPRIIDLAASIDGRARRVVSWNLDAANPAYRFDTLGVWFGPTSPVTITGEPTIRVSPTASLAYSIAYRQTAPQWVAIAALDGATRGPAAELSLAWDTVAPAAPGKLEVEAPA